VSDPSRALLTALLAAAQKGTLADNYAKLATVTGLAPYVDALPKIVDMCASMYAVQREAYDARQNPPPRPANRPKTNSPLRDWMMARDEDDWDLYGEDWDQLLGPREGSKGRNRKRPDGPPTAPLYFVFQILEAWYHRELGKSFPPQIPRDTVAGDTHRETLLHNLTIANDAGRLFYFVARYIDPLYTTENCNSVTDGWKRRRKTAAGQETLKLKNRKAAQKFRAGQRARQ
jgi:hypothetical protein